MVAYGAAGDIKVSQANSTGQYFTRVVNSTANSTLWGFVSGNLTTLELGSGLSISNGTLSSSGGINSTQLAANFTTFSGTSNITTIGNVTSGNVTSTLPIRVQQLGNSTARTVVGDANYTATSADRVIVYTSNLTANRTVFLPPASSYPQGIPLLVADESNSLTLTRTLTISVNGSDIIRSGGQSVNESNSTEVMYQGNGSRTLWSDGNATWRIRDQITARQLSFPYAYSGAAQTGICWINGDAGYGSIFMDSVALEMRQVSAGRIALVPGYNFQGTGFLQFGADGADGVKVFLSSQGAANATYTSSPSHLLNFNTSAWQSNSSVLGTVGLRSNFDTTGDPYLEIYAPGSRAAGTYNSTTGRYVDTTGNLTARIGSYGIRVNANNTIPAYSFNNATTTGVGLSTGSDLYLMRAGTSYITLDNTPSIVMQQTTYFNSGLGISAGTSGFNSIFRSGNTTIGINFETAGQMAFASSSVNQMFISNNGTQIQNGNLTVSSNATFNGTATFVTANTTGNLTVGGNITAGNLTLTNTTIFANLKNTNVTGNLTVSNGTTLLNANVTGNFTVTNATTLSGNGTSRFLVNSTGIQVQNGNFTVASNATFVLFSNSTAPANTTVPVTWGTISNGSATYKIGLFQ